MLARTGDVLSLGGKQDAFRHYPIVQLYDEVVRVFVLREVFGWRAPSVFLERLGSSLLCDGAGTPRRGRGRGRSAKYADGGQPFVL